jgi:hypothetical protein
MSHGHVRNAILRYPEGLVGVTAQWCQPEVSRHQEPRHFVLWGFHGAVYGLIARACARRRTRGLVSHCFGVAEIKDTVTGPWSRL